ncbi:unnamed protein product [Ectocarpus sp. 4 AP-2014]
MKVAAAALLLLLCIGWTGGVDHQTTTRAVASRLQFPLPAVMYRDFGYEHEEALFGPRHPFGGIIAERVIHGGVQPGIAVRTWTLCSSEDVELVLSVLPPNSSPFILMVDRGECTFANKVRTAQKLGAVGVIFADNMCRCSDEAIGVCSTSGSLPCEEFGPAIGDDGSGADITIPSFMMKKMDAWMVKSRMAAGISVVAEMSWPVPAPDGDIE